MTDGTESFIATTTIPNQLAQALVRIRELEALVRNMETLNPMTPEDYLKRPYTFILIWDEDIKTWTGKVKEFPGCFAEGDMWNTVYWLRIAAMDWIATALDQGQEIPEPEEK